MNNIIALISGFIISLIGTVMPIQKNVIIETPLPPKVLESTPSITPTLTLMPTNSASISAVPTLLITKVPTKVILPTPTIDGKKNEACNQLNLPISVFSGIACLPKDISVSGEMRECWNNKEPGKFCGGMDTNWESEVVKYDLDKVRNRILAQCQKVSLGDFSKCNESIILNAGRLTEEVGKGLNLESEINSCFEGVNPNLKGALKEQTAKYMKKNKLKQKLEEVYSYCFTHGFGVNDLHY